MSDTPPQQPPTSAPPSSATLDLHSALTLPPTPGSSQPTMLTALGLEDPRAVLLSPLRTSDDKEMREGRVAVEVSGEVVGGEMRRALEDSGVEESVGSGAAEEDRGRGELAVEESEDRGHVGVWLTRADLRGTRMREEEEGERGEG